MDDPEGGVTQEIRQVKSFLSEISMGLGVGTKYRAWLLFTIVVVDSKAEGMSIVPAFTVGQYSQLPVSSAPN